MLKLLLEFSELADQLMDVYIFQNSYLQYFIGMKEYGLCPFGASTLVALRKRFSEKNLAAILEKSVPEAGAKEKDDSNDGNDLPNSDSISYCPCLRNCFLI